MYEAEGPPRDFKLHMGNESEQEVKLVVDEMRTDMVDQLESMKGRMTAFQEQMRINLEGLCKQLASGRVGDVPGGLSFNTGLSYKDIKEDIERKMQMLQSEITSEREREALNVDLEKLFIMLENTMEYQQEKMAKAEERRIRDEPIDRKALEVVRARYSEAGLRENPGLAEKWKNVPVLKLISMDPAEIVKKHANDWKFMTINECTAEELRAVRAALPKFAKSQLRQIQWAERLDERIDRLESGQEKFQDTKPPQTPKPKKQLRFAEPSQPALGSRDKARPPQASDLFSQINKRRKD